MAVTRELRILEIAGLRLDQSLAECGDLTPEQARIASEAKFTVTQRAFRAAIEEHADLIVMHSEILSSDSAAGRAPWFLARMIQSCRCPVIWMDERPDDWMKRFVETPANLVRMMPGEVVTVTTGQGPVALTMAGAVRLGNELSGYDPAIGCGPAGHHASTACDLWLDKLAVVCDAVSDFVSRSSDSLVRLHTLKPSKANLRTSLDLSPIGACVIDCQGVGQTSKEQAAELLIQEVDSAAGRYFAAHPQTQLLLIDLCIVNLDRSWDFLWGASQRMDMQAELNRLSRHPGCRVRSIRLTAPSGWIPDSLTPVIRASWSAMTDGPSTASRPLSEFIPEAKGYHWATELSVAASHSLALEAQQAVLHRLRSAS